MTDQNIHNLACAIILQATRDYFVKNKYATEEKTEKVFAKKRKRILKDLRSPYMDLISGGLSVIAAEKLEKNPREILTRIQRHERNEKRRKDVAV